MAKRKERNDSTYLGMRINRMRKNCLAGHIGNLGCLETIFAESLMADKLKWLPIN